MNRLSYEEKLRVQTNPTAQRLLTLMLEKQTNLCASLDVYSLAEVFAIVKNIGDAVCMIKTHADIYQDASYEYLMELHELAQEKKCLIFEDRKFADIGNTAGMQYAHGPHRIVEWSDMTNAHIVPGPGIITGLRERGLVHGRGLLLLAEMSSEGALMDKEYRETAYRWAQEYKDFVIGFIGKGRIEAPREMIMCTPGIHLEKSTDALGQVYQTPANAIAAGTDVIIVGRGIYQSQDMSTQAKIYRTIGWDAYREAC